MFKEQDERVEEALAQVGLPVFPIKTIGVIEVVQTCSICSIAIVQMLLYDEPTTGLIH